MFSKKIRISKFSKITQNCFAHNSATKYHSEAVLYLKLTAGYLLSPHIKTIVVAFQQAKLNSNKNVEFHEFGKKHPISGVRCAPFGTPCSKCYIKSWTLIVPRTFWDIYEIIWCFALKMGALLKFSFFPKFGWKCWIIAYWSIYMAHSKVNSPKHLENGEILFWDTPSKSHNNAFLCNFFTYSY